jgi:hypothetical protein
MDIRKQKWTYHEIKWNWNGYQTSRKITDQEEERILADQNKDGTEVVEEPNTWA